MLKHFIVRWSLPPFPSKARYTTLCELSRNMLHEEMAGSNASITCPDCRRYITTIDRLFPNFKIDNGIYYQLLEDGLNLKNLLKIEAARDSDS